MGPGDNSPAPFSQRGISMSRYSHNVDRPPSKKNEPVGYDTYWLLDQLKQILEDDERRTRERGRERGRRMLQMLNERYDAAQERKGQPRGPRSAA
jgi:hypothetical protein